MPYSYYFVDCDAFGEYYDDYTPERTVSQRQDVESRLKRLEWISNKFGVPIGSEGGYYMFATIISIAEGIFTPVIGWGDPDMTNKASKYYLGRYYPPDEPEVVFKPTELKDIYVHLYFDPRFRLPLYEAVFHDSVITSAHWDYSSLKFSNVEKMSAITEILYQVPPLYHLNLSVLERNKDKIIRHSQLFGRTHSYSYKYTMTGFEFLTSDRGVQKSTFGDLVLVANYSKENYTYKGTKIPCNSILILKDGHKEIYTP